VTVSASQTLPSCSPAIFQFTKEDISSQKEVRHILTTGHYYVGVKNDDNRVGTDYRKLYGNLLVAQESDPQSNPIVEDSFGNLKYSDLPWRKQFFIPEDQSPATFLLRLSILVGGMLFLVFLMFTNLLVV
jgi:hypothetical protein